MTATSETCDLLIRNGQVLTMDAQRTVHPCGAIAIQGHGVAAVGPEAAVLPRWRSALVLDAQGAIVHPGFVDAHLHVNAQTCRGSQQGRHQRPELCRLEGSLAPRGRAGSDGACLHRDAASRHHDVHRARQRLRT